jgi:hypothetical protein
MPKYLKQPEMKQYRIPSIGLSLVSQLNHLHSVFREYGSKDNLGPIESEEFEYYLEETRNDLLNMMSSEAEIQRNLREEVESLKETVAGFDAKIGRYKDRLKGMKNKKTRQLLKELTNSKEESPEAFEDDPMEEGD